MRRKPGRPKVTNSAEVVSLLVSAFRDGLTVREACAQSGISHEAYYKRCREDQMFSDKMTIAKLHLNMSAKRTMIQAIKSGNISAAKWWLERHDDDFRLRKSDCNARQPSHLTV